MLLPSSCYVKIIGHSAKYPSLAINGLLVGHAKDGVVTDVIPLFHGHTGMAPMIEVALMMVEEYCSSKDISIIGYYHGNERYEDNEINAIASRISEKIAATIPKLSMLQIQNNRLASALNSSIPAVVLYRREQGGWMPAPNQLDIEGLSEGNTQRDLREFLSEEKQMDIVDFDDHMLLPSLKWLAQ